MGTEGLHMIRGPPPLYKLLLMDTTPDGRFAADVKLWNDSAIPPPPPPSTVPGAKKPR
jgi:hypothetical protein